MRASVGLAIAGVLAAGCGSQGLADRDAGGTGVVSIDAAADGVPPTTTVDGATDVSVAIDTARDLSSFDGAPPGTGHRSFAVTSQLQQDGGASTGPTSHAFTLVLYDDLRT